VTGPGGTIGAFEGPILFKPIHAEDRFRVESIQRFDILNLIPDTDRLHPRYRGALEVARGPSTAAGRVNLVNVVELESYVPGVVANESIASFHMEALKAQAIAARGYSVANLGRYVALGFPFDIVDSSSSQVYRGLLSEHPRAAQASAETRGLVASYTGRIISALYSSSFGGHSESNEWIFPFPPAMLPGLNITPYLRGVYDGEGVAPDFMDPGGAAAFWGAPQPLTFDSCPRVNNRFARWSFPIPASAIKTRMLASPSRHIMISGTTEGPITSVEVAERDGVPARMSSGRVAIASVTFTTGVAEVRGWDNLRRVLGAPAVSTPVVGCAGSPIAAGFVLNNPSVIENEFNADGTYKGVKVSGGGWGHNVGMSQYGAHGRARAGQTFLQILKSYYLGVDVGSYPIDIGREPRSGPATLRQEFFAPNARGVLEVRPAEPGTLNGLIVHLNETYDIVLGKEALAAPVVRLDVSPYLLPGVNVVQYIPVGRTGAASVTVIVD
jgi:stage II sporulation protein D